MSAAPIPGFDYVTGKAVAYTAAEWRAKYPPNNFKRYAGGGETQYCRPRHMVCGDWIEARRVAEAYAIIPAGKVSA